MKKIITLVSATLLTISAFSNAGVDVYNSGKSFRAIISSESADNELLRFSVQPNYVRILARDVSNRVFTCSVYSDAENYDELKELIYSIKNESTVYMNRVGYDCVIGSYRIKAD